MKFTELYDLPFETELMDNLHHGTWIVYSKTKKSVTVLNEQTGTNSTITDLNSDQFSLMTENHGISPINSRYFIKDHTVINSFTGDPAMEQGDLEFEQVAAFNSEQEKLLLVSQKCDPINKDNARDYLTYIYDMTKDLFTPLHRMEKCICVAKSTPDYFVYGTLPNWSSNKSRNNRTCIYVTDCSSYNTMSIPFGENIENIQIIDNKTFAVNDVYNQVTIFTIDTTNHEIVELAHHKICGTAESIFSGLNGNDVWTVSDRGFIINGSLLSIFKDKAAARIARGAKFIELSEDEDAHTRSFTFMDNNGFSYVIVDRSTTDRGIVQSVKEL